MVRRAFTVLELLVVIAVIGLLSAILLPVFVQAKGMAKKAACAGNLRQISTATETYIGDYDDRYMPIQQNFTADASSSTDRTWVQLLLPYARSFSVFVCPSDTSKIGSGPVIPSPEISGADLYSQYYSASQKTNYGYNYMVFSPVVKEGASWESIPKTSTEIEAPSKVMMFVDSANSITSTAGPQGGGSYIVEPPCRYEKVGDVTIDVFAASGREFGAVYSAGQGIAIGEEMEQPLGGAYAWHNGRANIGRADGSVKSISMSQLSVGCNVKAGWEGNIYDPSEYIWADRG